MKNGDRPASPLGYGDCSLADTNAEACGLTKREAFAMAAMQGLLANTEVFPSNDFEAVADGVRGGSRISRADKIHADALLAALEAE